MTAQSHIFAGVAGYVGRPEAQGDVGVFRRAAEGGEWRHVLPDLETFTVAVHPTDPAIVLAGTADGVWRSTNRGETFARTTFPDTAKQIWSFLVELQQSRPHLCRRLARRHLPQRRSRCELASSAEPGDQGPCHGPLRSAGDAHGATPEAAERDLCRA